MKGMTGWDSNIPKKRSRATGDEADADWSSAHTFSDETSPKTQLFKYAFRKCVKTPFFLFPCSCDRTKTTPVPFSDVSKVVNDFAMKRKTSALHGIPRKRQTQELN